MLYVFVRIVVADHLHGVVANHEKEWVLPRGWCWNAEFPIQLTRSELFFIVVATITVCILCYDFFIWNRKKCIAVF